MKEIEIIKKDASSFVLYFNTEEECSRCFCVLMNTCDRKELKQINIINTEIK